MSGFKNDVVVAKNGDFSQAGAPNATSSESNGLITNGQLWIGSTATNAGGTHINVGTLTSPDGSVTIGYSSPNITLTASGGVTYSDEGGSTTVDVNTGSFATATVTLTTPATAGLVDGDTLEFVATTANALTIQFAATQVGHIGNVASSAAGTFVSTAIGDAVVLRYQASTNDWWATSVVGNWTIT